HNVIVANQAAAPEGDPAAQSCNTHSRVWRFPVAYELLLSFIRSFSGAGFHGDQRESRSVHTGAGENCRGFARRRQAPFSLDTPFSREVRAAHSCLPEVDSGRAFADGADRRSHGPENAGRGTRSGMAAR